MLTDIERKILRIIANFDAGRHRMPTIEELEIKTGRDRAGVMRVLATLAQERYIEWKKEQPNNIVLLQAWEREEGNSPDPIGRLPYGRR